MNNYRALDPPWPSLPRISSRYTGSIPRKNLPQDFTQSPVRDTFVTVTPPKRPLDGKPTLTRHALTHRLPFCANPRYSVRFRSQIAARRGGGGENGSMGKSGFDYFRSRREVVRLRGFGVK